MIRSSWRSPYAGWVFSQLHLPRPMDGEQVEAMLLRMAADRAAPPLVFEARAGHGQLVRHLAGTPAEHVVWVQRTLRHLLPGLDLDGITEPRPAVQRSVSCPAFSGQGILRLFTRLPAIPAARP
jgi:hypothetical protein